MIYADSHHTTLIRLSTYPQCGDASLTSRHSRMDMVTYRHGNNIHGASQGKPYANDVKNNARVTVNNDFGVTRIDAICQLFRHE